MPRKSSAATPLTTAQKLGAVIKSARKIMRKDKGLSGDLDRLPMLTWIMFLKFLDDLELAREQAASLARKKYIPAIDAPYRWRDWANDSSGMTGDTLTAFINNDEAARPDGRRSLSRMARAGFRNSPIRRERPTPRLQSRPKKPPREGRGRASPSGTNPHANSRTRDGDSNRAGRN